MPIGVLTDNLCVALGGIIGGLLGSRISDRMKESLNKVFGFAALAIGINLIVKVNTLGSVVLSVILGTCIGTALRLDDRISAFFSKLNQKIVKKSNPSEEYMSKFTTLLILCCCSGTGIFGAMNESLTGDSTTILCKAILDFFTVLIFATVLGKFTAVISIAQMAVLMVLFFGARLIMPWMTDEVTGNFSAVGGIIELTIAMNILGLIRTKSTDLLPALLLIFPISAAWLMVFGG